MASASQSARIDRLQVGDIFVRPPDNKTISTSYILISNGGGSTRWDSVSSILPISSFKTVVASDGSSFSADTVNNVLRLSTTSIPSTFNSYIDPLTSSVMFSVRFPPIVVSNGSVPFITNTTVVPNIQTISSSSLASTIRFYGVGDIYFSTVNTVQAVYVGISSFTSAGYSTLNGEMINNAKLPISSFSTAISLASAQSFTSSIPFINTFLSPAAPSTSGADLYMSSATFDATFLAKYVNLSTNATSAFIEYMPNLFFPQLLNPGYTIPPPSPQTLLKQVTSYVQINYGTNRYVFPESSNIRYIYSQNVANSLSNIMTDTIKMTINPYTISSYVGSNLPLSTSLSVFHMVSSGVYSDAVGSSNIGFNGSVVSNTPSTNSMFITINNRISLTS